MTNSKQKLTDTLKCGHCDNKAPMKIRFEFTEGEPDEETGNIFSLDTYQLLDCPACQGIILQNTTELFGIPGSEEIRSTTTLYPADRKRPIGLPKSIAREYESAMKVRKIDANAYGVLMGRLLEIVCEDRQAEGRTLNDKLADLSSKGEIPDKLVSVAKSIRQLRNHGAHATLGGLSASDVPVLDDLARAILEYLYSAPELVRRAEARLKISTKKKEVKKKD